MLTPQEEALEGLIVGCAVGLLAALIYFLLP